MDIFTAALLYDILKALGETFLMVGVSLGVAIIFGIPLALGLFILETPLFGNGQKGAALLSTVINLVRSIPFVILLILLLPLTRLVTGTTIGPLAASVPLSVASIAFIARLGVNSFRKINKGTIEAALSSGASMGKIVKHVLLTDGLPSLVNDVTVTAISQVGYSAMAGIVGGGGLGDLAIRFGYYRYETAVMIITVVILIIMVQLIQLGGDTLSSKLEKR